MTVSFTPPETPVNKSSDSSDLRIRDLLGKHLKEKDIPRVVILGFPVDEGVSRNGGRPGAKEAPGVIREALYKLCPDAENEERFCELLGHTMDLGDLVATGNLEQDQELLGEALTPLLKEGTIPVVIGGGHETSYGHFLGYVGASQPVKILNWDAHTDVRELKDGKGHSGSPFRQALLHPSGTCEGYSVAGLQPQAVSTDHLKFVREQKGSYVWRDDVDKKRVKKIYGETEGRHFVTFDVDAVSSAYAPGVSAPSVRGLNPELWYRAAKSAGNCSNISSFDIVEVCPAFDVDGRTAKLAALTVWYFLKGVAKRF